MRWIRRMAAIMCACCAIPAAVLAQPDIRADEWSHGTTLTGFAGVAADSRLSGPVLGGSVGWELTPRLAIEGGGAWIDFGDASTAFAGSMKLRAHLFGHRPVDPFVAVGVGMYRASFGPGHHPRAEFYERRMHAGRDERLGTVFTDPSLVAGAGFSVFVSRNLAIRPDVEANIVFRDRRSHVAATVVVHAVYHFEERPVTPARNR